LIEHTVIHYTKTVHQNTDTQDVLLYHIIIVPPLPGIRGNETIIVYVGRSKMPSDDEEKSHRQKFPLSRAQVLYII